VRLRSRRDRRRAPGAGARAERMSGCGDACRPRRRSRIPSASSAGPGRHARAGPNRCR
jgi:hypothetical protein